MNTWIRFGIEYEDVIIDKVMLPFGSRDDGYILRQSFERNSQ